MLALDIVSLLLTKEDGLQAATSLSPALRDLVGVGVLGASKLGKSQMTEARLQDHKTVATGWKFADIDRTADSLLTSASRLQKEMTVEAKYWAEVLAVSDKGWAITHVPNEPQNLGVRYGFSEAASDFRVTSLAPMRRSEDGSVNLDCGTILGDSKRLLVTLERDGRVVGRSSLPEPLPQAAPLEDVVLEARNTIFAQELWHEMNREGRQLLSYGVRIDHETLSYSLDQHTRVVFSLHPLDQNLEEETARSPAEDHRADALGAALQQLLTYAHQVNNQRRSRVSPRHRVQTASIQPYQLLRPMLAHAQHEETIEDITRFISDIITILQSASIRTAHFKLTEPAISPDSLTAGGSPSTALLRSLLGPQESRFEVNITPQARILIQCQTALKSFISTTFHVYFISSGPIKSIMHDAYPPSEITNRNGYMLPDIKFYLQQAIPRILIQRAGGIANQIAPALAPDSEEAGPNWVYDFRESGLINANAENEKVEFAVVIPESPGALVEGEAQHPELHLHGAWNVGQPEPAQRTWVWTVDEFVQGIEKEALDQVVREVVGGTAR